jgi:hypothetical protein
MYWSIAGAASLQTLFLLLSVSCSVEAPNCQWSVKLYRVTDMLVVQAVDPKAVQKYAQKLLSGKACGMLLGDQVSMPSFGTIARRYGQ